MARGPACSRKNWSEEGLSGLPPKVGRWQSRRRSFPICCPELTGAHRRKPGALAGSDCIFALRLLRNLIQCRHDIAAAFPAIGPCQRPCGAAGRTRRAAPGRGGSCQREGAAVEHRDAERAFAVADRQAGAREARAAPRAHAAADRSVGIAARRARGVGRRGRTGRPRGRGQNAVRARLRPQASGAQAVARRRRARTHRRRSADGMCLLWRLAAVEAGRG